MIESIENSEELANLLNEKMQKRQGGSNQRLAIMLGMFTKNNEVKIQANIPNEDRSTYNMEKYKFFLDAPFEISNKCCDVMKKDPVHRYSRETGRMPITAQMADESNLRTQKWLQNGCNAFNVTHPISNPMSFWTEQDVLQYIVENKLKICSVYGDVVEDFGDQLEGQMTLGDFGLYQEQKKLKCTGCSRTGCVLCGFGCHLGKKENRFEVLKETHPKFYALLDVFKNNGITYRQALEWTNEHLSGRGHIYL